MERRGAHNAIEGRGERKIQEIGGDHLDPVAELGLQEFTGRTRHILRDVERDDRSVGKSLKKVSREATGASPGVENKFVASEMKPGEDLFSPANLGLRETMIFGGIPFAGV